MSERHLSDQRLIDCDLAVLAGQALDPPAAEHLADCAACAARFAEWRAVMDSVRAHARTELDEMFPPAALETQRRHIARRIACLGHQARVLAFPERGAAEARQPSRSATRWVAAAAAIGLFVGGAVGRVYGPAMAGLGGPRSISLESRAPRPAPTMPMIVSSADALAEGRFLDELELAIEQPQTRALIAFDTLTPQVREIGAVVR
jgi:anti-sigma factor RsiW